METLLSVAFDYLASFDGPKIKKGLRQIEGLLAQVCISAHDAAAKKPAHNSPVRDQQFDHHHKKSSKPKYALSDLTGDAAFQEFFKLQDGFQWNIATRLIQTLDKLYAKSDDGSLDLLMLSALDSLQGCLLLHPPSRHLFSRTQNMNVSSHLFSRYKANKLTFHPKTAPPRPPRAHQLPRHPVRHPPGPRRRPARDPAEHAHL